MSTSTRTKVVSALAGIALSLVVAVTGASPAGAATPMVRNDSGTTVRACTRRISDCQYSPFDLVRDNQRFTMVCWKDDMWWTGNYRSNRWFRGRFASSNTLYWVHSSYIVNQTRVGRC
jgi:hypothetical protein